MAQLHPYVHFHGNCKEAMTFYKSVLGGDLNMMKVEGSPAAQHMPKEMHDQILHSQLKNEHITLFASDMGPEPPKEAQVALCLVCSSQDEAKRFYDALSVDGHIDQAWKEEFFGWFGMFSDKFGLYWMVQYSKNPNM